MAGTWIPSLILSLEAGRNKGNLKMVVANTGKFSSYYRKRESRSMEFVQYILRSYSASPRILSKMKKGILVEKARDVLQVTLESGIFVMVFVIVGFPSETSGDFEKTVEFVVKNQHYIDALIVSTFDVHWGSHAYRHPEELGIKIERHSDALFGESVHWKPCVSTNRTDMVRNIWHREKTRGRQLPFPIVAPSI